MLLKTSRRLKSGCIMAIIAPQTMAAMAKHMTITTTVSLVEASGSNGKVNRRNPYVPNLTPANTTDIPIGPCTSASGNHVWKGKTGALKANPMKMSQKIKI